MRLIKNGVVALGHVVLVEVNMLVRSLGLTEVLPSQLLPFQLHAEQALRLFLVLSLFLATNSALIALATVHHVRFAWHHGAEAILEFWTQTQLLIFKIFLNL
jgi:hypothetical protein